MAVDSLNVGEALCAIPEQLAASHELAGKIHRDALPSAEDFDHIVTLGMGGSGIAGDILQAVGTASLPMPLAVLKHYRTPAFIGERTLAFALSARSGFSSAKRCRRMRAAAPPENVGALLE